MKSCRQQQIVPPVWLWVFVVSAMSLDAQPAASGAEAEAALESMGMRKGICVVLGLPEGGRPEFVAEVAGASELTVYFQSASAEEVAGVRASAEAAGLLGTRVFVDQGDEKLIHLADNLAGAVLVSPAVEADVDEAELLRVLHPQGKLVLPTKEIVKPFPPGVDDWSYPYHGPDNNPQSADRIARAPYLTQFLADPKFGPSPAVTVASGGRIFRAFGHLSHKSPQNAMVNTLLAANAHNGTVLWKRPLSEGFMVLRNTFIATPDTLYLADDQSCKLLDAATGELKDEITAPADEVDGVVWKWMAVDDGVLFGLIGAEEFQAPTLRTDAFGIGGWPRANWPGFDYQDPRTAWAQGRTLLAIDLETKKLLWRHREQEYIDGRAVLMRGGRVSFLSPGKFLGCLDAATGKVVWKTSDAELLSAIGPLFTREPRWTGLSPFPYAKCNDELLFFSGPRMPRVVAVTAADGKLAWQRDVPMIDGGSVHLVLRDDAVYAIGHGRGDTSSTMDYATGDVLTRFLGRRACTIATGSADSIFYRAPGGTVRLDLASGKTEHIAPMRPPCYEGVIISGGLIYWGPWKCRCQLSLYGHIALAPAGDFNYRPGLDASRLALAPGDPSRVERLDIDPDDWPCYEGDDNATCTTEIAIPKAVRSKWTFQPASAARPTAPVVAGGVAFLGDHNGAVRAIDASDGKLRWKVHTGGAVFFPPAVWEGRVYVGSADGHVYAFEALTGRPLWKFRAAPARRWIPVFGKLASTWPVAGGVVVDAGTVYAAAGMAHYDGTHVYALDAVTGKSKWYSDTSGSLSAETSSGVSLQGSLFLDRGQLHFAGGNACRLASYDLATGQCTSLPNEQVASGFRTAFYPYYPEHGQYVSLSYALADGGTLDYGADYSGALHTTLARFGPPPPGADRLPPNWRIVPRRQPLKVRPPTVWEHKAPVRYNSFIVAPGVLLAAGQKATEGGPRSFLAAVNVEDGSEFWREKLPERVVKRGAAVDRAGRIFVSLDDARVLCFAAAE